MALRLQDCPPELRAKIEAQLAKEDKQKPPKLYAMATFLNGKWTIGPLTTNKVLVDKLVARFNISTTAHAYQTFLSRPPAVTVETQHEPS